MQKAYVLDLRKEIERISQENAVMREGLKSISDYAKSIGYGFEFVKIWNIADDTLVKVG